MKHADKQASQQLLADAPQTGERYRHYKGGEYEVVCSSIKEDTGEVLVTYRSLAFGYLWSRTLSDWNAFVPDEQGALVRRFAFVKA